MGAFRPQLIAPSGVRLSMWPQVATIAVMKTVGIRELKNSLSKYLRQVRSGEGLLVTDRGEVVAELLPPGQVQSDPSVPAGLASLAKRGLLTLGAASSKDLYPALPRKTGQRRLSVARLLDDERGTR